MLTISGIPRRKNFKPTSTSRRSTASNFYSNLTYGLVFFKITRYAKYIAGSPEHQNRLSYAELTQVLEPYVKLIDSHLQRSFVNSLPERFQELDARDGAMSMIDSPSLDKFVFCRANTDIGTIRVNNDDDNTSESVDVTLNQGDIYCLRYQPIQHLVLEGQLNLV